MEKNVKTQLMELWKKTFHDSDEYISLVFDSYFDSEMVEYEEREGKIIAALLAIPYLFGKESHGVKGVYLCGLATYPQYRGEGIMTQLLERISNRMEKKGYSFLFLIPAEHGLVRYYEDRGFIPGFYRQQEFYTSVHDFTKGIKTNFNDLKCDIFTYKNYNTLTKMLDRIILFIRDKEGERKGLFLNQDQKQIEVFIRENLISGGEIYIVKDKENMIRGIVFYTRDEESGCMVEKERYVEDENVLMYLRNECKKNHPEKSMTIEIQGEKTQEPSSIWEPAFSSVLPGVPSVGAVGVSERVYNSNLHSEIYGMVKVLRISEILKFATNESDDLKYSILTQQENSDKFIRFSNDNTGFKEELIEKSELSSNEIRDSISTEVLSKILFRRPGGDKIIEEVSGLPSLNGQISMLLD